VIWPFVTKIPQSIFHAYGEAFDRKSDKSDTDGLAKKQFCRILKTMSAQETLIEEIKRQPEPVVREVLHYLKFLERQRAQEEWADVLPAREVEQEKLDILDGK
jgi:hypothetical protein